MRRLEIIKGHRLRRADREQLRPAPGEIEATGPQQRRQRAGEVGGRPGHPAAPARPPEPRQRAHGAPSGDHPGHRLRRADRERLRQTPARDRGHRAAARPPESRRGQARPPGPRRLEITKATGCAGGRSAPPGPFPEKLRRIFQTYRGLVERTGDTFTICRFQAQGRFFHTCSGLVESTAYTFAVRLGCPEIARATGCAGGRSAPPGPFPEKLRRIFQTYRGLVERTGDTFTI